MNNWANKHILLIKIIGGREGKSTGPVLQRTKKDISNFDRPLKDILKKRTP
jgi:hypothetical protein